MLTIERLRVAFLLPMFLVVMLCSCGSEEDNDNEISDDDSAAIAYNREKDSIQNRLDKIGGFALLHTDEETKCNLVKGFYSLDKKVTDSSDLAFLATYLARELLVKKVPETDCSYQVMTQAFIYTDTSSFKKGTDDYLVMASMSLKNILGDTYINDYKLKALQREERK